MAMEKKTVRALLDAAQVMAEKSQEKGFNTKVCAEAAENFSQAALYAAQAEEIVAKWEPPKM